MTTVRLPPEIEQKLESMSVIQHKTKSELIKEALEQYFTTQETEMDSYEIGKQFFGLQGSGKGDLSSNYKNLLKEKIRAKHNID